MSVDRPIPLLDETLVAINQTITKWENIEAEDLGLPCPLCRYVRSRTKVEWKKATKTGTCEVCPVWFAGLFYVCVSISSIMPIDSDERAREFKNIQTLTLQKLKVLKTFFSRNTNTWLRYEKFVEHKRAYRGKLVKRVPEVIENTRKIIRRKK